MGQLSYHEVKIFLTLEAIDSLINDYISSFIKQHQNGFPVQRDKIRVKEMLEMGKLRVVIDSGTCNFRIKDLH